MSSERGTYNGWTNYETWLVALWLGNDPGTQHDVEHLAGLWDWESAREGGTLSELGDEIQSYVADLADVEAVQQHASLAADLLGAGLAAVAWTEIAAHYVEVGEAELERRRREHLRRLSQR